VRAVERRGAGERGGIAGVIDLAVVVGDATHDGPRGQARHQGVHLPLGQVPVVRHSGGAASGVREDVVEQHAGAHVEAFGDAFGQRVEKPHRLDQMRGQPLQQQPAFSEGLTHQAKIGLLEVADAAMHELGRPARRSRGPVAGFENAHTESTGDGVHRTADPHDAAADHQDVQFLGLELGQRGLAFLRPQFRGPCD